MIDWETFRHDLNKLLTIPTHYETPDDIDIFTQTICTTVNDSTCKRQDNQPSHPVTQPDLKLICEKNRSRKIWQRSRKFREKTHNRLARQIKWDLDKYRISK